MDSAVTDEEKRASLARVLASRTFGRSEQLRAFLRYVCEAEFEGRAHQLNEYALGVSVLRRREGYSPAEDSVVRSRAYDLRNKLKTYYRDEAPDDPIWIAIDKGGYVPRFVRKTMVGDAIAPIDTAIDHLSAGPLSAGPLSSTVHPTSSIPPQASPIAVPFSAISTASEIAGSTVVDSRAAIEEREPEVPQVRAATRQRIDPGFASRHTRATFAALVMGVLLMIGALSLVWTSRSSEHDGERSARTLSPEMQMLWGPFLDGSAPVLVSYHTRLFFYAPAAELVIRDVRTNEVTDVGAPKPIANFQERMGATSLIETYDYSDVGAVRAAFLLGRLLNHDATLEDSRALGWEDVWNSHIVFVGKASDNAAIDKILRDADLDFVDAKHGTVVQNLRPGPGELAEYPNAATHGAGTKYGIVTVLPGPQPGHRLLLLTASAAELEGALAHAVTEPTRVAEIMGHVVPASGECPRAFQVVLEVTFASNVPTNIHYVAHRVYEVE